MQKEVIDHYNCGHDTIVLLPGGKYCVTNFPNYEKGATLAICPIISKCRIKLLNLVKKESKLCFLKVAMIKIQLIANLIMLDMEIIN